MALRDTEKNTSDLNATEQPVYPPRRSNKARWIAGIFLAFYLLLTLFTHHTVTPVLSNIKKSFEQGILKGGVGTSVMYNIQLTSVQIAQYSPQFDVNWGIPDQLPETCTVDMVNILERHGARYPAHKQRKPMVKTLDKLHSAKQPKDSKLKFVSKYNITKTLGEEDLVWLGREQAYNSGTRFHDQYKDLIERSLPPFYRAPSSPRVIESAQLFRLGFNNQSIFDPYQDLDVVLPEGKAYNNTLDISNCPLASNHSTTIGDDVSDVYAALWTPQLSKWWNSRFPGANLNHNDIVNLFHTCAFDTVANNGTISDWCKVHDLSDFHHYAYYLILQKYYDSSYGHPLGRARGIGYVNELIARLTSSPVVDSTSTNTTIDSNPDLFPLPPQERSEIGHRLFVDFSHDTSMVNIISALGLARTTRHLPFLIDRKQEPPRDMFDISKYVPFAGRIVFEKIHCGESIGEYDEEQDYVRIKVNEGVYPLKLANCGTLGTDTGLCRLEDFLESQSWNSNGGNWNECYED